MQIGKTTIVNWYRACIQCARMDAIALGLAKQMKLKQGVLAEVVESGDIYVGEEIHIVDD